MATYTGTADTNGDFTVPFSSAYTGGEKISVTAEKDGVEKTIELYAPSGAVGGGVIKFSGTLDNFPNNIGVVTLSSEINKLNQNAFIAHTNTASIWKKATGLVIEGSLTNIPSSCFSDWTSMKTLVLPSNLTNIDNSAFYYCSSLETMNLPNSLLTIRSSAFAYCQKLKSLVIPDLVTTIEAYAFRFISAATLISIGTSVTNISTDAFINASACNELILKPSTPPTITATTFSGLKSTCVIKVPAASLAAYQAAANWSVYAARIQAI